MVPDEPHRRRRDLGGRQAGPGGRRAGSRGRLAARGVDTWDVVHALLTFADGTTANLTSSWVLPESLPSIVDFKYQVVGSEGSVDVDLQDQSVRHAGSSYQWPGLLGGEIDGRLQGPPTWMAQSFAARLAAGEPVGPGPAQGRRSRTRCWRSWSPCVPARRSPSRRRTRAEAGEFHVPSPTLTPETARENRPLGKRVALIAASIGVIYGYDSGSISGALIYLRRTTTSRRCGCPSSPRSSSWAACWAPSAGPGSPTNWAARSAWSWSRADSRSSPRSAPSRGVWWLTAVRLLLGVTIGLSTVVAPIFISEFAPDGQRGRLATSYQFFTSAGVVVSLLVGFALAGTRSWELMLGIAAVPSLLVLLLIARFPDSPRWYGMKGRWEDARRTLLRVDPGIAERRLTEIREDLAGGEAGHFRRSSPGATPVRPPSSSASASSCRSPAPTRSFTTAP
ncbi:MFS transporter [Streptomyces sp. M19]